MTKDEALKLAQDWYDSGHEDPDEFTEMIKQVIALAEQPAQQQEPVALDVTVEGDAAKLLASMLEPVCDDEPTPIRLLVGKGHSGHGLYVASAEYQEEGAALLVNTSPPASKPWVALTEYDIDQIPYSCSHADSRLIAFAIEAKLKDKNAQSSRPLTDEEIILIVAECAASHQHTDIHFARAIEAAHGIKGDA